MNLAQFLARSLAGATLAAAAVPGLSPAFAIDPVLVREFVVRHIPVDCYTRPCPQFFAIDIDTGEEVGVDRIDLTALRLPPPESEQLAVAVQAGTLIVAGTVILDGEYKVLKVTTIIGPVR